MIPAFAYPGGGVAAAAKQKCRFRPYHTTGYWSCEPLISWAVMLCGRATVLCCMRREYEGRDGEGIFRMD